MGRDTPTTASVHVHMMVVAMCVCMACNFKDVGAEKHHLSLAPRCASGLRCCLVLRIAQL